jgi:hypothetical protein
VHFIPDFHSEWTVVVQLLKGVFLYLLELKEVDVDLGCFNGIPLTEGCVLKIVELDFFPLPILIV